MGKASEAARRLLMVATTLRFWPEYQALEQLASSGGLGHINCFFAERLSPPITWNTWMADEDRSGGVAVDLMIHDLDLVERFLGAARQVLARGTGPSRGAASQISALIQCEHGVASVNGAMTMPTSYPFSSMARLAGTKGSAELRYRDAGGVKGGNVSHATSASVLEIWRGEQKERLEVHSTSDPWEREVAHFVECLVEGRTKPRIGTLSEARRALALSLAVRRAVVTGLVEEMS
jgi:UDP-N-acetylglucosamine 3-dehydrogenase